MSPIYNPSPPPTRDYLLNGGLTTRETFSRDAANALTVGLPGTTGILHADAILLYAGDVITNVTLRWGSTAATVPTNWWFALYDTQATPALIAQTADQTTTAITANTSVTLALQSPAPYTVLTTGIFYVAQMVRATATPTLVGRGNANITVSTGLVTGQKFTSLAAGSNLAATAPGTLAGATGSAVQAYVALT